MLGTVDETYQLAANVKQLVIAGFHILLDTLEVIMETVLPANHLVGSKNPFFPTNRLAGSRNEI